MALLLPPVPAPPAGTDDPSQVRQHRPSKPQSATSDKPASEPTTTTTTCQQQHQHLPTSRSTSHGGTPRHLTPKTSIPTFRKKPLPSRLTPSNPSNNAAATGGKPPPPQFISALSQKLAPLSAGGAHTSGEDNPFTHFYAALAGRADGGGNASCEIQIYYHVVSPKTGSSEGGKYRREPKVIRVRQDTSVEELIGYVLWCYWGRM